jgi:hypothetical protein
MTTTQTTKKINNRYYFRVLMALATLAVAASLLIASAASPAHAAGTLVVNSTGDEDDANTIDGRCDVDLATSGNQCTLRAAITQADQNPGLDIIDFNIPGSGVHTIKPGSFLLINDQVTIDGYSQPGASENTLEQGGNAVLKIELNGSGAGANQGLIVVDGSGSEIKGLAINSFRDNGIRITGAESTKVEGNFIGTDPSGTTAKPNTNGGVRVSSGSGNTVGGDTPATRNVISGNFGAGVEIESDVNDVLGNFIGTDKNGTGPLGNGFDGVFILDGSGNEIGGTRPGEANTIAFNSVAGVGIDEGKGDATNNAVFSNSIFSNAGLGIDLDRDGATTNETGDADTGANNLQNFPVLTSAKTDKKGTTIKGKLNSIPNKSFTVQFFASPEADSSGFGEGKTLLGEKVVTTNTLANASFTFKPTQKVSKGQVITATATDGGNTSEFSAPKKVTRA